MSGAPGSWAPDFGYNPAPVQASKETSLSNLRTALGAGVWVNAETAWHMAGRMTGSAINENDLGDYYYCLYHWGSH